MQSSSTFYTVLPYTLPLLALALLGWYWFKRQIGRSSGLTMTVSPHARLKETQVTDHADADCSEYRVISPGTPRGQRTKGRQQLPTIQYVDFDAGDKEHCRALQLLIQQPARLHPKLRFHFDTQVRSSAYDHMLHALAEHHIKRILARQPRTKPEQQKVVPLNRGSTAQ